MIPIYKKKIISEKYKPSGKAENAEFRTTLEIQYEFQEMIYLHHSGINTALSDLGFEIKFIDNKPNWVLYPVL
jgi:hypothetical protein